MGEKEKEESKADRAFVGYFDQVCMQEDERGL